MIRFGSCKVRRMNRALSFEFLQELLFIIFRSHIKHSEVCFIRYSNTLTLFKETWLRLIFLTYFSVFGYLMKHTFLCLIYYVKNNRRFGANKKKKEIVILIKLKKTVLCLQPYNLFSARDGLRRSGSNLHCATDP